MTLTARRPLRPVTRGPLDWLKRLLSGFRPDLSAERDAIAAELRQTYLNAVIATDPNVDVNTDLVDRASEWALDRAGELITDIADATRDGVRELVASAVQDGRSPQELRAALMDYSGFGRSRAETIGRTESAYALGQAQRGLAVDAGQDEKNWQGGECEECAGNEADGWIGIDDEFSGGVDTIPQHPRCTCTVIYRTKRLHTDSATATIVKVARCPEPHCRRLLGRDVNVGAQLWCAKCREAKVVQ